MRVMDVLGVRVEMPTNQPIVLLRERGSDRHLPIWIGAAEASAIAYAQQGIVPPRPLTHDLLVNVLATLGHHLGRIRITTLTDGAFHAVLELTAPDGSVREVDSRSSDAIALALRTGAEIVAEDQLLNEVAVRIAEEEPRSDAEAEEGDSEVLAEFTKFLDTVSPEDFETGPETPGATS